MKSYHKFLAIALIIIVSALIAMVFWGNYRGIDFTDESLGIVLAQSNQETGLYITQYHLIVKKLLLFEPTIINLRFAFFACCLFNSLLLSYFLQKWLNKKHSTQLLFKQPFYHYLFIILGLFFAYQHQRTISYDVTHVSISLASFSLFLLFIIEDNHKKKIILITVSSFLISFLFTTRITSAALQTVIMIFFFFIHLQTIPKLIHRFYYAVFFVVGIFLSIYIYHIVIQPLPKLIYGIYSVSDKLILGQSYQRILKQTFFNLPLAIATIILSVSAILFVFKYLKNSSLIKISQLTNTQILSIGITIGFILYTLRFFQHSSIYFILYVLFMTIGCSLIIHKFSIDFLRKISTNTLIIYFLLLLQPIIMVVGTDTSILGKSAYGVMCWFVFIYAYLSETNIKIPIQLRLQFIMLICLHCAICLPYNLLHRLYRTLPLIQQTENLTNLPRKIDIKVNKSTATYINKVYKILLEHGFKKDDYILTDKHLGVAYLVGGKPPAGFLWSKRTTELYLYNLQHYPLDRRGFFAILPVDFEPKMDKIFDELEHQGIEIRNYDKIYVDYLLYQELSNVSMKFCIYVPKKFTTK